MRYLILLVVLCLSVWGLALPAGALEQGFIFWRNQGINLSGLIAIALMGALILMATRPRWLEQRLGGLDHLYQLHKWSGITAGSMVLLHWLLTKSPRWLVDWGLLQLGPRPAGAHVPDAWRGIAKEAGEYCFYAMILFIIISLVKVLPYGRFRQIHKVGAVLFLLAAFHSVYLLPDVTRWAPFGLLTLTMCVLGSLAAFWSLFGQIGRLQRYQGAIVALQQHEGNVLELEVALPTDFQDEYLPGQFALLTLHEAEGSHPFTIVREDVQSGTIIFAIKALLYGQNTVQYLHVHVAWQMLIAGILLSTVTLVLSARRPAKQAAKSSPVAAMRGQAKKSRRAKKRTITAAIAGCTALFILVSYFMGVQTISVGQSNHMFDDHANVSVDVQGS